MLICHVPPNCLAAGTSSTNCIIAQADQDKALNRHITCNKGQPNKVYKQTSPPVSGSPCPFESVRVVRVRPSFRPRAEEQKGAKPPSRSLGEERERERAREKVEEGGTEGKNEIGEEGERAGRKLKDF